MATVLYQIILALNLLFGEVDASKAQEIYNSNDYSIVNGVIIIDTDEL